MGDQITRFLPNNEYQAAVNANAPTAINPFATINDLAAINNFATADLTFTASRTHDLAGFNVQFDTGGGGKISISENPSGPPSTRNMEIYVNTTEAVVAGLGTTTPGGTPVRIIGGVQPSSRGIILETPTNILDWYHATNAQALIHDASAISGSDKTATWRNLSGTVAYLSDIPAATGDGIYDGSGNVPAATVATLTDSLTFDGGSLNLITGNSLTSTKGFHITNSSSNSILEVRNSGLTIAGRAFNPAGTFNKTGDAFVVVAGQGNGSLAVTNAPLDGISNNTTSDNVSIDFTTRNTSGNIAKISTMFIRNRNVTPGSEYGVMVINSAIQTENSTGTDGRTVISTRGRFTSGHALAVLVAENRENDTKTVFQIDQFSQNTGLSLAVRSGSAGTSANTWNWRLKNNHEFEHNYGQLATGDFIMRGLTDANLFRADASADRIGIGVATPSSKLDVSGDIEIGSTNAYYLGDPTTDTSWRIIRSGDDLLMQQRESGTWNTKSTIFGV